MSSNRREEGGGNGDRIKEIKPEIEKRKMLCTIDLLITPPSPITLFLTSSSPASEYLLENQFIFNVSIFLPPSPLPPLLTPPVGFSFRESFPKI